MHEGKVLITGGRGRLARVLKVYLEKAGWEVWAPHREELDLAIHDLEGMLAGANLNWIVHPAACSAVDLCQIRPDIAHRDNVWATRRLVDAATALRLPGITLGTDYVFGDREGPFREDDPPGPINIYGQSKWEAEQLSLAAGWAVARTAWLWGDGAGFPKWVVETAQAMGRVEVLPQWGVPTHLADVAQVLVELGPGANGIYHLVGDEGLSRAEWARLILDRMGLGSVPVVELPHPSPPGLAPRPRDTRLLNTRGDIPRLRSVRGCAL